MSLIGDLLRSFMERGARNLTLQDLAGKLRSSGGRIAARFGAAADTPGNRNTAAHVIGIERWGQRRLRTLLGEPLVLDEYDGYRPAADCDMSGLRLAFAETRAETLRLVDQLQRAGVATVARVRHNQLGDLSIGGWLMYLNGHSSRESARVK
jgi:DinB superfamily